MKVDVGYGADNATAVLSGNADGAQRGTEAAIYVHNGGREDVPIVFGNSWQQRAGKTSLWAERRDPDFTWDKVRGNYDHRRIEKAWNSPESDFEYILHQHGLDPKTDLEIITNLDLSATAGAFTSGTGDYTTEFEPGATTLEMAGSGHVVASLGVDSGYAPYTVYMTTQSFLDKNPELAQGFTNAIYKGLLWCQTHTAEEIAQADPATIQRDRP
ncbi:MAG: ABC transporter substrate-binding protein [Clostridia bacterium]